ncbi:MAG TPA: FAD-dependent monooxygenase, partial [Hyphomicrobiaceae bacterium]|nr:FAD-dependent monooxygenase [Hyphomicrobiaceae bacterium]
MKVIIAGAGIAGLASGLALVARGIKATIVEQVAEPGEVGAGLQLGPNAVYALKRLGVADGVGAHAVAPEAVVLSDGASGRELGRVPLGRAAVERYGSPYWTVHRGDLHGVLLAAARRAPDVAIVTGRQVVGYEATERDVTVRFGNGDEMVADALIGADGVWSRVRTQMYPDITPVPSGYVAYRAVLPLETAGRLGSRPEVGAWLTPEAHLIHYPVSAGARINVVLIAKSAWSERSWSIAAERDDVVRALRSFPQVPRGLADAVPWLKWSLGAPVKLPALARGRVALIGDAGHA